MDAMKVQESPALRVKKHGFKSLTDCEVLGLLIGVGATEAAMLVDGAGNLRKLIAMDHPLMVRVKGMTLRRALTLQAALELMKRHLEEALVQSDPLTSPEATRGFLKAKLRDLPHEVFAVLFLDNRHRVIAYEELFRGTIDGSSVHPREVVKAALAHNAAALIFAHNHPSGVAEPSHADERLTRRLRDALALVDIRVLDHVVVGDGQMVSFAERGLL